MATGVSKTKWNGGTISMAKAKDSFVLSAGVQLVYPGKKSEQEIFSGVQAHCVTYWSSPTANGHNNTLYFGDNLPVMLSMLSNPIYAKKIRLVYIDPPYATNSVFQARGMKDAYADLLQGADYLEFLRERLTVIRELLADDGSIYVHLDENMAFEVKLLMDEVFGKSNFRNWITRKKCSTKNTTKNCYGDISDYILFYTKSSRYVWNRPYDEWPENKIAREYPCVDPNTGKRYKKVPIHAPGVRNGETGKPWRGMMPPPGKHWQYTPSRLDEMDANGEIYWSASNNPRRKVFFDPSKGIPIQDIWLEYRDSVNQNIRVTGYPTEKNLSMLETIIQASSNPGDIVMDCFCGSGSALQAAYSHDRQWVGIDNSVEAISATLRRFHMGVEAFGDYVSLSKQQGSDKDLLKPEAFALTLFEKCPLVLHVQDKLLELAVGTWGVMNEQQDEDEEELTDGSKLMPTEQQMRSTTTAATVP